MSFHVTSKGYKCEFEVDVFDDEEVFFEVISQNGVDNAVVTLNAKQARKLARNLRRAAKEVQRLRRLRRVEQGRVR